MSNQGNCTKIISIFSPLLHENLHTCLFFRNIWSSCPRSRLQLLSDILLLDLSAIVTLYYGIIYTKITSAHYFHPLWREFLSWGFHNHKIYKKEKIEKLNIVHDVFNNCQDIPIKKQITFLSKTKDQVDNWQNDVSRSVFTIQPEIT